MSSSSLKHRKSNILGHIIWQYGQYGSMQRGEDFLNISSPFTDLAVAVTQSYESQQTLKLN